MDRIVIPDFWYAELLLLLQKPFELSPLVCSPAALRHVFNFFEQSVKVKDLKNLRNQKRVASFYKRRSQFQGFDAVS